MIAEAVLKSWNARPIVASVSINASGSRPKLTHTEHATATALTNTDGLRWSETDDALPLPLAQWKDMWGGGPTVGLVIGSSSDFVNALDQEPLTVSGLKDGVYSLRIDGQSVGTFTNDQLAKGINLALLKTPMSDQAMSVYQLTSEHGDRHYDRWRHIEVPLGTMPDAAPAMSALDNLESKVVEKQAAAFTAHRPQLRARAKPLSHNRSVDDARGTSPSNLGRVLRTSSATQIVIAGSYGNPPECSVCSCSVRTEECCSAPIADC